MGDYLTEFDAKAQHKGLNPESLESRIEKILPTFKSR
jgi:hypothetical protein